MASSTDNYYPDLISFIKNIPNSEITSILKLMQNRAAQDIQSKVLEIDKLVSSMFNAESEMTDDDLIYWYYTMRRLSNKLEKAEEKTLTKLNTLRDGYLCSRCETYVPRNYNTGLLANLQNHNCNAPIAADLPTVKMKEILKEYELFRSIHYDNNIEEQLFYRVLVKEKKEVFYVYTIHVLDKEIFCLVCGCNLPGKPSILQHILGNNHVKTLNKDYDMILTFHQNFLKLEPNYQMLQTEFSIVDIKKVECAVCDQQISFKKLRKHLTGPCFNTPTDEEKNIPVTYEEIVKTTIYKDLLEWCVVIDGINCPILQNIDNKVYCLVCNKYINTHIYTHIDLAEHRDQLSAKNTKQTLKLYHQSWIVQPAHIQIQQIYFRRREQKITCSVCSNFLYYGANHLQQHIESPDHKKFLMRAGKSGRSSTAWETWPALTGSSRSASVETNVDTWTSSSSSERIESTVDNKLPMRTMECRKSSNLEKKASQSGSSGSVSIETDSNNWVTTSSSVSGNGNESATSEIIKQDTTTDSTERAVKEEVPEFQVTIVNEQLKSCQDMLTSAKAANASINKGNNYAVTEESIEKETDNSITKSVSVDYPQEVFNKLYGGHLIHYYLRVDNVKYPLIQNMDGYNRCLICTIDITGSILFHINSTPHIQLSNDTEKIDQLKKYHDLWMQAREEYQYDQVKFDLGKKLMCKYCLDEVEYELEAVIEHILSTKHVLKKELPIDDSCSGIDEIENSIEVQPTTVLNEDPVAELENKAEFVDTQDCIRKFNGNGLNADESSSSIKKFDPNDDSDVDDSSGNEFADESNLTSRSGKPYCYFCERTVGQDHSSTKQHLKRTDRSSIVFILLHKRVDAFLEKWNRIGEMYREMQRDFIPASHTFTLCLKCGINVNYDDLEDHLERFHNKRYVYHLSEKLSPTFRSPLTRYPDKINRAYFRENIPQCNIIINSTSYPIFQASIEGLCCLLCRAIVDEHVNVHLGSELHLNFLTSSVKRRRIVRYHDIWSLLDMKYQRQMFYFNNVSSFAFKCIPCDEGFAKKKFKIHLENQRHLALLRKDMNSALYNSRTDTPLFLDITSDIQVRSEHDTFKLNMNSVQCSQLDGNYNTDSDSDDAEENSQCYFKSVVDECYPDFDKDFNIVWNGNRYPIFRKTVIGLVCMICKSNPHVPSVEEHLKKQTHFLQAVDKTRQRKLIEFHKVWMEEESSVQMHQKYFHRMKCLPCSVQVNYEAIADHIFNGKHQRKIMLSANLTAIEAAGKDEDGTLKDNQDDNQVASLPSASTTNNSLPIKNQERKEGESSTSTAGNNNNSENAEATPRSIHRKSGHDIKKSVANPDSPNILERLPLRFSILTMFLVVDSNENISCQLCITNVKNDLSSIKEHLKSKNHLAKYVLGTKKMRYFCEICNKQCDAELSWEKHMMESNHISRCNNLGQTRKDRITEYECLTCGLVLYGDDISVRRHNALFGRRKIKELVLPKAVISLFANRDFINANSKKLLEEANKASHSQDKEQQVCVALVRVLKPIFPNCKAYPFGSRVTGLGYCDSDLDVFLDTGDMYHGNYFQEGEKQADIVNLVAKTLKKHKTSFTDLNKVAGARTPIVQVFHKDTGIDCDISFKHGLSVENTAFISLCLDLQPILRPTMLYLKEWSASTNITGLSSYALTMLVIFYMQTVGYLLSVKELRILNPEESEVIADWDTIKYSVSLQTMKEHVEKCEYTVIQLMEKFFEYYANFDFDKCVVSPLLGEAIAKTSFNGYGAGLPLEMAKYVSKLSVRNPEFFRNLSPMCVQDPFDLSHNLTKACSKSIVNKFRGYCNLSMKHLRALE